MKIHCEKCNKLTVPKFDLDMEISVSKKTFEITNESSTLTVICTECKSVVHKVSGEDI